MLNSRQVPFPVWYPLEPKLKIIFKRKFWFRFVNKNDLDRTIFSFTLAKLCLHKIDRKKKSRGIGTGHPHFLLFFQLSLSIKFSPKQIILGRISKMLWAYISVSFTQRNILLYTQMVRFVKDFGCKLKINLCFM